MDAKVEMWEGNPIKKVVLSDGEYWVPVCTERIYANVCDVYPDGFWNDQVRKFGTGKQTMVIRLEYEYNFEDADEWDDDEEDYTEVPIGIYRVGKPEPLWTGSIPVREMGTSSNTPVEPELGEGPHFIVFFQLGMSDDCRDCKNMKEKASPIPCGVRYDFTVYPDGSELAHPKIKDVKLEPRPFSEWKSAVMDDYIESKTMRGKLSLEEPFDLENNFLSLNIFDESKNWRGWGGYANREGQFDILGFYPLLDGNYQFVVRHNDVPIVSGRFVNHNGTCTVEGLEEWCDDNELCDVLPRYNKVRDLVFDDTPYGRQLKVLREIWEMDNTDDLTEWEELERRLFEL